MGVGGGPPSPLGPPTKSAYGHPKMEEGVERISVFAAEGGKKFLRLFSAVTIRGELVKTSQTEIR